MKNAIRLSWSLLPLTLFALSTGCSTFSGGGTTGEELAASGPTVVDVRMNPETVELDTRYQPSQNAEIIAEVKDFTSKISNVKLRFVRVPMEVPMQHVGGTTWRAQLNPDQLRTLAVGGQTVRYDVNVIAENDDGQVAVSKEPLTVAVKSPDLSRQAQG